MTEGFGSRHFQALLLFFRMVLVPADFTSYLMEASYLTNEEKLVRHYYSTVECVGCVVGGVVSAKLNNKYVLLSARGLSTLILYATPSLVELQGGEMLITAAFLQAFLTGFTIPCVFNMLSNWFPRDELETVGPLVWSGFYAGYAVFFSLARDLQRGNEDIESGKTVLIAVANMELVWSLAWWVFGAESADRCWFVSSDERLRLASSVRTSVSRRRNKLPWKAILTNGPLIAATFARFTLATSNAGAENLRKTLKFLGYDIRRSFTRVLPHGLSFVAGLVFTIVIRFFTKRNVPKKALRYTTNSLSLYGSGIALILAANAQSIATFFSFMMISEIMETWELYGLVMNYFDHSTNYVGLTSGISFGLATLGHTVGLELYEDIREGLDPELGWRVGHFLCGAFLLLGNFVFTTWGSVEIQPYDSYCTNSSKRETSQN